MSVLLIGEITEARIRRCLDEVENLFEMGNFYEANWLLDSAMISTMLKKLYYDKAVNMPRDLRVQITKINSMARMLGSRFVLRRR
jgi:glutaredoxin 2